jgi:ATP-binding cassette, subfamily B, bacterial
VTADTGCVRELVMNVYLPLLTSLVTVVSMFAIMWQLSPALALFALALTIPLGLIIRVFAGRMTDRKYKEWKLQGELSALIEQTLTALPLGREDQRFQDVARRTVQASVRSEVSQHQFRVSSGAVAAVAAAIVMAVGGWAVLDGSLKVGSLLVLIAYFAALYSPIETLAYLSEGFASAGGGARRILEIIESDDHGAKDLPGARPFPDELREPGICVRFDQVSFGYGPAGSPGAAGCVAHRPAGRNRGARRRDRSWQEHALLAGPAVS